VHLGTPGVSRRRAGDDAFYSPPVTVTFKFAGSGGGPGAATSRAAPARACRWDLGRVDLLFADQVQRDSSWTHTCGVCVRGCATSLGQRGGPGAIGDRPCPVPSGLVRLDGSLPRQDGPFRAIHSPVTQSDRTG
jgi:hypothetical protein